MKRVLFEMVEQCEQDSDEQECSDDESIPPSDDNLEHSPPANTFLSSDLDTEGDAEALASIMHTLTTYASQHRENPSLADALLDV